MSKLKYKFVILHTNSKSIRVEHELIYMGPYLSGKDHTTENWNEQSKSRNLIQSIVKQKSLAFMKLSDNHNTYYQNRLKNEDTIEMIKVLIMGDGFTKKIHLYDVVVVQPQFVANSLQWVTFKFNDTDIDEDWSLHNP